VLYVGHLFARIWAERSPRAEAWVAARNRAVLAMLEVVKPDVVVPGPEDWRHERERLRALEATGTPVICTNWNGDTGIRRCAELDGGRVRVWGVVVDSASDGMFKQGGELGPCADADVLNVIVLACGLTTTWVHVDEVLRAVPRNAIVVVAGLWTSGFEGTVITPGPTAPAFVGKPRGQSWLLISSLMAGRDAAWASLDVLHGLEQLRTVLAAHGDPPGRTLEQRLEAERERLRSCNVHSTDTQDVLVSAPQDSRVAGLVATYHAEVQALARATSDDVAHFRGAAACGSCHGDIVKHWKSTKHARAMVELAAAGREGDPSCLPCHTTGFFSAGGYRVGRAGEEGLTGVQCESCHGAAGDHPESPARRPFKPVTETTCSVCHDALNSPKFSFGAYLREVSCRRGPVKER
jgi:hypothetical protein